MQMYISCVTYWIQHSTEQRGMLKIVLILGCLLIVSLLLHETDLNRINKWHNWIGLRARAECCAYCLQLQYVSMHVFFSAKRLNYVSVFDILQSKWFSSPPCANLTCKLKAFDFKREIWKNELENCCFDIFAGLFAAASVQCGLYWTFGKGWYWSMNLDQ